MASFKHLSRSALVGLADSLKAEKIKAPFYGAALRDFVPKHLLQEIGLDLNDLFKLGMAEAQIAQSLYLLAEEKGNTQNSTEQMDLVWTGHQVLGTETRNTQIVVQELFNSAQSSILISSYVLDKGDKAKEIFQLLMDRMDANPDLSVKIFLNVPREYEDQTTPEPKILADFFKSFNTDVWSGLRLPEIYYFPPALERGYGPKACLHAKCVVIDKQKIFVTSANFTEAAHERNIEVGVLMKNPVLALSLCSQFEKLINAKIVRNISENI